MALKFFILLILVFSNRAFSQDSLSFPIYFKFKLDIIDSLEKKTLSRVLKNLEKFQIDSIKATGYCDDIGSKKQNDSLSKNRADSVLAFIRVNMGEDTFRKEYSIGLGKIPYDKEVEEAQRDRNRRVDLVIYYTKEIKRKKAPSVKIRKEVQQFFSTAKIGDRLQLSIIFHGSSHKIISRSEGAMNELYEVMKDSKMKIEIQGHICCEPDTSKDGFDMDTKTNDLSYNRAREVYDRLVSRGIDKTRMQCRGFGVRRPSGRGQDNDRRVEIEIVER